MMYLISRCVLVICLLACLISPSRLSAQVDQTTRVNITLPGLPLIDAMDYFADELGVTILIDSDVGNREINANLRDLPVLEAFETLLKAHRLWYEVNETGRAFLIKDGDEPFSGRITERILVDFIELTTVEGVVQRYTASSGSYIRDERTNSFVVTDTPNKIAELRNIIETLDVPSSQVMIEVEIVAFDRTESDKLGISWDFLGQISGDSPIGSGVGESTFGSDGNFSIKLGQYTSGIGAKNLLVNLEALERNGVADILASPRLLTINRQAAVIRITENTATGTRVVQSTSALGQTVTEPIYSDVGVTLNVTPFIAGDSLVVMHINPSVSTARRSPFFPTLAVDTQNRSTETRVMAHDSQTIVIGGLHQKNTTQEIARVPILGHIPLLGYFFSQRTSEVRRTELIIFITPRIITADNLQTLLKPIDFNPETLLNEDEEN